MPIKGPTFWSLAFEQRKSCQRTSSGVKFGDSGSKQAYWAVRTRAALHSTETLIQPATDLKSIKRCPSTIHCLDSAGKGTLPALVVPLCNPRIGAQIAVYVLKVLAHLVALALHLLAAMEVQIALVAVLGLVRVRETRIEGSRLQRQCAGGCCWGHFADWGAKLGARRRELDWGGLNRKIETVGLWILDSGWNHIHAQIIATCRIRRGGHSCSEGSNLCMCHVKHKLRVEDNLRKCILTRRKDKLINLFLHAKGNQLEFYTLKWWSILSGSYRNKDSIANIVFVNIR